MTHNTPTPNHATKKLYVTKTAFDGGANFREIARVLTNQGEPINHATARNLMVSGIKKVLQGVASRVAGKELSSDVLDNMLKTPETFQMFSDILHMLYPGATGSDTVEDPNPEGTGDDDHDNE